MLKLKRAYEPAERGDGRRILVDRLWPRGIRKSAFAYDAWYKEIAPSNELRKSFAHRPERWKEFKAGYRRELRGSEARAKLSELARLSRRGTVTLLYSAKDPEHNNAVVLREAIERS